MPNLTSNTISRQLFYQLWTLCVGTPTYNKQSWKDLEHQLISNNLMDKE
jgi:hypothetical protein